MSAPLRLMIYDRTCRGHHGLPGLTRAWQAGAWIYRGLRRFDAWQGASSWEEALRFVAEFEAGSPIASVQFWGHGKWGEARVDREVLDAGSLAAGHPHRRWLAAIRARMLPGARSLWWFRTCETLGARAGQEFGRRFSEFMEARVAGHTYIIGPWQSGLHSIGPGERPGWAAEEGILVGTPERPERARWSRRGEPYTIHCLQGELPGGY